MYLYTYWMCIDPMCCLYSDFWRQDLSFAIQMDTVVVVYLFIYSNAAQLSD